MKIVLVLVGLLLSNVATAFAAGDWKLSWADEFDGSALDRSKWGWLKAGYNNNEQSYYAMENAVVADGSLRLIARKDASNPDKKPYTSAAVTTRGKFSQAYGRFEARMKLPQGSGYWPAFWLMPETDTDEAHGPWPMCGEIDILETGGERDTFISSLHFANRNNTHACVSTGRIKLPAGADTSAWNVYAVEWEPMGMRIYFNDRRVGEFKVKDWWTYGPSGQLRAPRPAPFDKPFYIILNNAVGGQFIGNAMPKPGNETQSLEIDYVRVYGKDGYEMPDPEDDPALKERAVRRVPVKKDASGAEIDTEQIVDGEFSGRRNFWRTEGRGGLSIVRDNGSLRVECREPVCEQHMSILKYAPPIEVEKGRWYRLSFRAKASAPCRHVRPDVERPKAGWQKLFLCSALALDTEWKRFSFDFQSLATDGEVNFLFYLGLMSGDDFGAKPHALWFDDVSLMEIEEAK